MTHIGYPDLVATSPDGAWRLEARNRDRDAGYEWKTFRYSTRADGARSWSRTQAEGERPPTELHVSDRGQAVIRTHTHTGAGVITVDARGRVTGTIDLMAVFEARGLADHVAWTTAGPFWSAGSTSSFLDVGPEGTFAIRTQRGVVIGIDLATGSVLPPGAWEARLSAQGAASALEVLRRAATEIERWEVDGPPIVGPEAGPTDEPADEERWLAPFTPEEPAEVDRYAHATGEDPYAAERRAAEALEEVRAAAIAAGQLGLEAAIAPLLALERVSYCSSSTSCFALSPDGRLGDWSILTRRFRQTVQVALRRLGVRPAGRAAYLFATDAPGQLFEVPEQLDDREARAEELRPGLPVTHVLQLLGSPDHVGDRWDEARKLRVEWWDFDLQEGARWTTLRVEVGRARVLSIVRVPPDWWDEPDPF